MTTISGGSWTGILGEGMNYLIIREVTDDDMEDVANLFTEELMHHIDLLPERFQLANPIITSAWYRDVLGNPDKQLFVAEVDGKIVGLLLLQLKRSPDDPIFKPRLYASVEEVAVTKRFRGQGIGRRLMDHALDWADEHGADEIELEVWEENRGSIALYEKLGYEVIRRKMRIVL